MFICITHVSSGYVELLRRLAPNESIDPAYHARNWADTIDATIAKPNGHIPCGCGDYYAETRHTKAETGSCWQSFDFYLNATE